MFEENVALVRRYYQVTSGDLAGIEDIVTPDFVDHHFPPNLAPGPECVRVFFTEVLGAFTDRVIEIDDVFASADRVGVRFKLLANHSSDFAGYSATGKRIVCPAMSMFRIENGKLAEGWEVADLFGLFQQLAASEPAAV
jgi:hypothetical protein